MTDVDDIVSFLHDNEMNMQYSYNRLNIMIEVHPKKGCNSSLLFGGGGGLGKISALFQCVAF